ncbi:MAG: TMEM165/GDT1 family protein [Acidimicrobiia bacterium]|jgi:Ca2+/H+ antiporter, TMEM165/GDT1 family|nr:TMEM165/GDT1 family protein [Acidimicrobiia bacterium]NBX12246.1 TMEM165/GDT1 family protein [Acidimicrobiia bacterium]NDF68269.1 TMEM165/GDT1 family protein [Actinomycetota bacterium]
MSDLFTAFGVVFLAELPDKTMFATLILATRYPRKMAVWCGVAGAYTLHVTIAALLGTAMSRLPTEPLRYVVGTIFVVAGAYLVWSSRAESDDTNESAAPEVAPSWRSTFTVSAATIGVAEFADITQLATASLAATRDSALAVGVGAALALASVSGIAVLAGSQIVKRVNLRIIQRTAGALFVIVGVATLV